MMLAEFRRLTAPQVSLIKANAVNLRQGEGWASSLCERP